MTGALDAHPAILVVLGGGLTSGGDAAPPTLARAEAAARVALERPDVAIICSGSHGDGPRPPRSEAAVMAAHLAARGVAAARVFVEDESRDTLDNAVYVAQRYLADLAPRPLVVITSPFHLERALAIFRHVLGPAWPVEGAASTIAAGDELRARNERRYLERLRAFLADTTPGDIASIAAKTRGRVGYVQG